MSRFTERVRKEAAEFQKRIEDLNVFGPESNAARAELRIRRDMRELFAEIHERFDALEVAKP